MPLINKILASTRSGDLPQPFSVEQLKEWMIRMKIAKDDGDPYAQSSIDAILSNSNKKNTPTSNKNRKVLLSRLSDAGRYEYWFASD